MAQSFDPGLLAAALVGYQQKLEEIDGRMAEIRKLLGGKTASVTLTASKPVKTARYLSPEARERIAAAQRKRWAATRAAAAPEAAPAKAKPARAKKAGKKKPAAPPAEA